MAIAASTPCRAKPGLARLWQLPLFALSLGVFGYAAYLFIDPKPRLTIEQKIELARAYLDHDRPEAAAGDLTKLLGSERLPLEHEATVHVLLAQSIEAGQRLKKLELPANHKRIIEQSNLAMSQGVRPDADTYRRLGESYAALGEGDEALKNYRRAEALDVNRSLRLKRKVIELQMAGGDARAAHVSLDEYLNDGKLSDGERAWGLGEKSHLLADEGDFVGARGLLEGALELTPDAMAQGPLHYRLGYCQWKLGDAAEAERLLRAARKMMKVGHPTDADAAYALGRIHEERRDYKEATAFYESVLVSHPGAPAAVLAKLGRGICRVAQGEDGAGLKDLGTVANGFAGKPAHERKVPEIVARVREAATTLATRDNFQGALKLMAFEQTLTPAPAPEFFARLATVYDKRSDQVEASAASAPNENEALRRAQQARDLRTKAGDAHLACARGLHGGGKDEDKDEDKDKAYGAAIWRAVDVYDRAGSAPLAIAALERFVAERPDNGLAPDALLRLGRAYQAAGDFERAVAALRRNQFRYPNSLAACKSGVPLAQAYIAQGPDSYKKAESVLNAVVDDNRLITPDSQVFRDARFELAHLHYRTERFEEAVAGLQELTERYPDEERVAQRLFLMGDSYRKGAIKLRQALAAEDKARAARAKAARAPLAARATRSSQAARAGRVAGTAAAGTAKLGLAATENHDDASVAGAGKAPEALRNLRADEKAKGEVAIRDRLTRAGKLYAQVIEHFTAAAPAGELDALYLKLSHFHRADCRYELGDYSGAIRLYDTAALHYPDDASTLAASVQIVNSYCALGQLAEARAANARAKGLLRKMPPGALAAGGPAMSKTYWEQWLKRTSDSGMLGKEAPPAGPVLSSAREPGGP